MDFKLPAGITCSKLKKETLEQAKKYVRVNY